jgi:acyl transferase domain-containing protein/NADP-dependent 3-hydroxy acid dehydrogenase YdfG
MTYAGAAAEPIAIIGLGALMPKAASTAQFWANIIDGIDCIEDVPRSRWDRDAYFSGDPQARDRTYCQRGGFIPDVLFDPLEFGIPPHALEGIDTAQLLSLGVARAAFADAGYPVAVGRAGQGTDHSRTGVILGVAGTSMKALAPLAARLEFPVWEQALRRAGLTEHAITAALTHLSDAYPDWDEDSFPGYLASVVAGRIANRFDLGGTSFAVDAACASGLCAVRLACAELRARHCDLMLTGGVDTDNSILAYLSFSKTPALSPSQRIRPFDASCDGTLIAEGIGMLVLKRLVDAEAAQDRIYAVIRGIGGSTDGHGSAITVPQRDGQVRAIRAALGESRVPPGSVGLIEAHGTGTEVGDRVELEALLAVYGDAADPAAPIPLGSIKSQIGHTKAAAGAAGLIKAALALHAKVLPPTLNVATPHPLLDGAEARLTLPRQAQPWFAPDGAARRAAVSAVGFGGANYHAVLEAYPAPQVVADDTAPDRRDGVPSGGAVVAVFSGQGSQYVGMGSRLAIDHPDCFGAVEAMDAALLRAGADPVSRLMVPHAPRTAAEAASQRAGLTRTLYAQAAVGAFSMGAYHVLLAAGLRPLAAIGHSFGEISALWAAGVLSDADYARLVVARGQALSPPPGHDGGTLLAVRAPADQVAALLARLPGLCIANINGPEQTVIGGPLAAVEAAGPVLDQASLAYVPLSVAAAFHTPCIDYARAPWQAALAGLRPALPVFPVFANATAEPYPADPDAIVASLAEQPFRAVRFQQQVEAAYAAGGRIFLEIGPKGALTRLIGDILGERAHTALAINPDPAGNASHQLQQAMDRLRALGVSLRDAEPPAPAPARASSAAAVWLSAAGRADRPARSTPPVAFTPSPVDHRPLSRLAGEGRGGGDGDAGQEPPRPHLHVAAATGPFPSHAAGEEISAPVMRSATARIDALLAESHQAFLAGQTEIARAVIGAAGVHLPAEALALLRDVQESGARLHGEYLASQAEIGAALLHGGATPALPLRPLPVTPAAAVQEAAPAPPSPEPAPASSEPAPPTDIDALVRRIIAEKTGYPENILLPAMNLEADLGLDSIKRIEILSAAADSLGIVREKGGHALRGALTIAGLADLLRGARPQTARSAVAVEQAVLVPLPPAAEAIPPDGVVLLADHASPLGDALTAAHARIVRVDFQAEPAALEQAWATVEAIGPVAGAVLLPPAGDATAGLLRLTGFLAGRLPPGSVLLTVVRLDGRLGLGGAADSAGAAAFGIAKTARQEWPALDIRALDIDPALPAVTAAACVFAAWSEASSEIGIDAAGRRTIGLAPPAPSAGPHMAFGPDDVILVTGGGRGITALCAQALATTTTARIVLLGRTGLTAEPTWAEGAEDRDLRARAAAALAGTTPREIAAQCDAVAAGRAVRRTLAALPGATYLCCDVVDPDAVRDAVASLGITALVHGAGALADRRIEDLRPGDIEHVFAPKIAGLDNVLLALDPRRLRAIALFSSTAGFFGNAGQAVYAAANEILNKRAFALARQMPQARIVALDWGPWQGGMVSEDLARRFAARGVALIAPQAGREVFLDLFLSGGVGAFQFVIGDDASKVGAPPQTPPGAAAPGPVIEVQRVGDVLLAV